jgi:hypothetical protein
MASKALVVLRKIASVFILFAGSVLGPLFLLSIIWKVVSDLAEGRDLVLTWSDRFRLARIPGPAGSEIIGINEHMIARAASLIFLGFCIIIAGVAIWDWGRREKVFGVLLTLCGILALIGFFTCMGEFFGLLVRLTEGGAEIDPLSGFFLSFFLVRLVPILSFGVVGTVIVVVGLRLARTYIDIDRPKR